MKLRKTWFCIFCKILSAVEIGIANITKIDFNRDIDFLLITAIGLRIEPTRFHAKVLAKDLDTHRIQYSTWKKNTTAINIIHAWKSYRKVQWYFVFSGA